MINSYNKRVKSRSFQVVDLVLRRADALKPVGKFDPIWEGPYKVTGIIGKGAYELEDPEGRPLPRPWNVHNLKIPLRDHRAKGAAPCSGPLKDHQLTGATPCSYPLKDR
ncbi:UNVERIFIED_CONTAM: hypothetical protein Sradi_7066200 [Sesamum radiatum]|uniref:Reverse transcriptase n=1 Tax=Sesamum radiatum TaxID=300843 RepID=A0AAW2J8A6_SESRA